MKENTMATNFKPNECEIFVQSTKIGTQGNKAIHSKKRKGKQIDSITLYKVIPKSCWLSM